MIHRTGRRLDWEAGLKAFWRARAAAQGHDPSAHDPSAAVNLGQTLSEQGDVEGARSAYQQAIDSGDPEHAPAAAFQLGILLGRNDDIDGAKEAYRLGG